MARHGDNLSRILMLRPQGSAAGVQETHENKVDYSMPDCYDSRMSVDPNDDEPVSVDSHEAAEPAAGLLRRQLLFLRRTWWSSEPVTGSQRVGILVRGVLFIAIGGIGLIAAVANTVGAKANGMEAVAKIMAEFLLIPIAILALIIVGVGVSLVIRGFVAGARQPNDATD
jgi:hypothetical protein